MQPRVRALGKKDGISMKTDSFIDSDTAEKLKAGGQKAKGFIDEFKAFATKGNALDLAIGVVMGTAFNAIITSLVTNIIMPLLSLVIGRINISGLTFTIKAGLVGMKDIDLPYGLFLQAVLNFVAIAFSLFLVVKLFTKLRSKDEKVEEAAPEPSESEKLLGEIRDILKESRVVPASGASADTTSAGADTAND
jgi:large conductance mechanosensitive channel